MGVGGQSLSHHEAPRLEGWKLSWGMWIGVAVQGDLPLALLPTVGRDIGGQELGISHQQWRQIKGGNLHIVEHYRISKVVSQEDDVLYISHEAFLSARK